MAVDNKRIAKNTIFMYIRLIITIPLAFYTSRVVLRQLGVDDYGIYQAVAGLITMFAVLRTAFDSATQRYYNVALAKDDTLLLSRMFSTSLLIQFIMVLILVVLIEVFGIWFIENEMQYPIHRSTDVYFVFHTTVISVGFLIINTPFSGMIVAKEHMQFYAYLSVLDVALRLGLVFLLLFASSDKLRLYAVFQMCVPILLCLLNVIYFKHNFKEVKIIRISKRLIKDMTAFSGWGLIGNICYSLVNEGVNLLLNVFGGVVANAARGIAYQVRGVLSNILTTTLMPVRPQATQLFVKGDYNEFWNLMYRYSKILFILCSIMVVPIIIYSGHILDLWLGFVPEYSSIFLQILMVYTLIRSFHEPMDVVFKASGRMKEYQLTTVAISISTFILGWIFLKCGFPIYTPFIIFCCVESILLGALIVLARKEGIIIGQYILLVIKPCVIYLTLSLSVCFCVSAIINVWLVSISVNIVLLCLLAYYVGLNKGERNLVKEKLLSRFSWKK